MTWQTTSIPFFWPTQSLISEPHFEAAKDWLVC